MYRLFRDAVLEAEAHPEMRVLRERYDAMSDDPILAWRYIERESRDGDGSQVITLRVDE